MSDFLKRHALRNVWCSPRQDMQAIIQPQRITPVRGSRTAINFMWDSFNLPTTTDVYHVYQIGAYPAHLMGLNPQRGVWRSVARLMTEEFLMCDIYTQEGLHFNRGFAWILVTRDGTTLLALREQNKIANLRTTPVFLRLYSNAFDASARSDNYAHGILCRGVRVTSPQAALDFQREFHQVRDSRRGSTWLFVNGVWRNDYPPALYSSGDFVEYVNDTTVKAVLNFAVKDLPTFDSILDSKGKYLLHYAADQVGGVVPMIDYRDDIDLYLYKPNGAAHEGVYIHKNNNDTLRMVTHRDYALSVPYVIAHQQSYPGWTNINQLSVRMFVRHSGYERPLVFEHHRIQELYKLKEVDRAKALLGVDSNVDVWRADNLENSQYTQIMDAEAMDVTTDLVKDAYGYNAIAKLIGDTPQYVIDDSGRPVVKLPYGLQTNSTVFEINQLGKLINSYVHTAGSEYAPFNTTCKMVEVISGRGGNQMDMTYNTNEVVLNPLQSYRFYVAPIAHGVLRNDQWADVTGDDSKYVVINGKVHWMVDLTYNAVCVKSDSLFLNYELTLTPDNGQLRFSINAYAKHPNGDVSSVMYIPPGRLDLWLNDEVMIENLDYFVKWPEVVVCNKHYLVEGAAQRLRVRASGFCDSELNRQPIKEHGFVRWGQLSRNSRYDLRDDRVIRLIVNGRTYHRDQVKFTETDRLTMTNVPNGSPYLLDDLVVPLRGVVSEDTYSLREKSLVVDKAVSDYLTLKLPEDVPANPDPIPERYAIFSPFASTVMYDLMNGRLSTAQFKGQYSDQKLRDFLSGYEPLLEYDPTRYEIDMEHVSIHPHDRWVVQELDIYQYRMLNRAIKIFLDDKVDITRFVRVKDSFI